MRGLLICVLLLVCCAMNCLGASTKAITQDGKVVYLHEDGTWGYEEKAVPSDSTNYTITTPDGSTEVARSKKGFVEIWYNPNTWSAAKQKNEAESEFQFRHKVGDVYVVMIVEEFEMTIETLKEMAEENARSTTDELTITRDTLLAINGREMASLDMLGVIKGIAFKYRGCYWAGRDGCVQVVAYTGSRLFDKYSADIDMLMSGIKITSE